MLSQAVRSRQSAFYINNTTKIIRPAIEVFIDLYVRSMAFVSEIDMIYSMDCYFRQTWKDTRLAYTRRLVNNSFEAPPTLALSMTMLDKIWKPDTYFYNGKKAYLHTITVPNKFVRIQSDGNILYSSRMTIKATCPMHLENFPMDTQICPLELGIGYSTANVVYRWNPARSVVIAPDMKMSQFAIKSTPSGNDTSYFRKGGPYSKLIIGFHFERYMGHFVIEVYVPCIMLVVLSWVSFWINREATADRIGLGITTILTMTFLGLESRNNLPKVAYCTALDYFVATSFAFIFATIVEFAVVHYFTKVGSGEYYFSPTAFLQLENEKAESDEERPTQESASRGGVFAISGTLEDACVASTSAVALENTAIVNSSVLHEENRDIPNRNDNDNESDDDGSVMRIYESRDCGVDSAYLRKPILSRRVDANAASLTSLANTHCSGRQTRNAQTANKSMNRISSLRASINRGLKRTFSRNKSKKETVTFQLNSVSQIDRISRIVFPFAFIIINFIYWNTYLTAEVTQE
ncbi:GABA-gated ion channel-like protein [Leptotrombidium deliense]|uniref:GABA-gated ion channel-like protein n=1 Tax=Leptotrombidium deliense TaxID=299467 RepID=A0A443SR45_9ACAR|nr:GABA-gated ion channel-like protein [Leptotrombidium deliense]